jgi:hypothetical protein
MLGMRTYLLTGPRWVVGLSSGLVFGIGMAAVTRFTSAHAPSSSRAGPATVLATSVGRRANGVVVRLFARSLVVILALNLLQLAVIGAVAMLGGCCSRRTTTRC